MTVSGGCFEQVLHRVFPQGFARVQFGNSCSARDFLVTRQSILMQKCFMQRDTWKGAELSAPAPSVSILGKETGDVGEANDFIDFAHCRASNWKAFLNCPPCPVRRTSPLFLTVRSLRYYVSLLG